MTTVIFVHGTGVRSSSYSETFNQVKKKLHAQRPDLNVIACLWGGDGKFGLGARLNANGASIPGYKKPLDLDDTEEEDENTIRWRLLYIDPLYELRLLTIKPKPTPTNLTLFTEQPGTELRPKLKSRLENLTISTELQAKLYKAGIYEIFDEARQQVLKSQAYKKALENPSEPLNDYPSAVARAIIATAIESCNQQKKDDFTLTDTKLRDQIVELIRYELAEVDLGFGSWLTEQVLWLGTSLITSHIQKQRLTYTRQLVPMLGDILLYQSRGHEIRKFIFNLVEETEPPVVLLAHSLGGIASVDLLAEECLDDKVKLLITVGSQAPFLYEIGALHNLKYGLQLPEHFPDWLNIYDPQDFLSYIGSDVFPKPNKITDIDVNNGKPFPQSHVTYWDNEKTWNTIFSQLP